MDPTPADDTAADSSIQQSRPDTMAQPAPSPGPDDEGDIELTVTLHQRQYDIAVSPDATLADLSAAMTSNFAIPESNQKFLVTPKIGLLKPPFGDHRHSGLKLSELAGKKITVMGSTAAEVERLDSSIAAASSASAARQKRTRLGPIRAAAPARSRDWKRAREDAAYTFHTLRPLAYLPDPQRSLRFLEALRDDPGIRAAMRSHRFSVALLTEMDPALHTTHEARTLGLNRNRGEAIELRLRTDAFDGYRDYRTIRRTLCHELAHNVWGEHDANFWRLTREIEREVERNDWTRGGRRLTDDEFYNPDDPGFDEAAADHGGWTGGEFVLGGGSGASPTAAAAATAAAAGGASPLSRREILAKAAEERMKKAKDVEKAPEPGDGGGRSQGSS